MMLELWGRETSSNVQAVRWALLELGVPFIRHDVGGRFGGLDTPAFRAMNPAGKIPVLVDQGQAIFESAAILRHLGDRYGSDSFWPKDPARRTQADMWAEWAKQDIANRFTGPIFWRVVRTPPARQNPAAIRAAVKDFETHLDVAEQRLAAHDFLAGPDLTPADLHIGHVLHRYFDIDIARREFPATRAHYERLTRRPAYAEAVMISYDSLRNTL